jgi:D-arabinitol 4-dehydrogenase
VLPALFFLFLKRWADGSLPYTYQDGVMQPDAVRAVFNAPDPLAVWAADDALFAGLAKSAEFLTLLRRTVAELEQWIKQPESQLAAV